MIKVTPNPPETDANTANAKPTENQDPASPYDGLDSTKLHSASDRALKYYLNPAATIKATPRKPSSMFTINPDLDTETLLAHACESLASANVMANDLAGSLDGTARNALLGIAQVIMLGELAVNRALDNIERQN